MKIAAYILCLAASQILLASDPAQWPKWRGPDDNGMARTDAPLHWSDTENIKWKTTIPGRGHSSPVLWGDKIFLTTAIPTTAPAAEARHKGGGPAMGDQSPQPEHRFEVLCLDKKTGKILWERIAVTASPHEGYHQMYGSFASNTPITDGQRVYAFFGSRGVYCYDLDGKLIWKKDFGVQLRMHMGFGEGVAPMLSGDSLILDFDQDAAGSFIAVLDSATGQERWRAARNEVSAWAMPLVVDYAGTKQVIVSATKKVRSYDLKTGKLIWECAGLGLNVIPTPVHLEDLVFVMSGFRDPNLMAIRLGRTGDLTGSDAIVWSTTKGNSYSASPVLYDGKLYALTDTGMLSCYNARTGVPYYKMTRLPKPYSFKSSPVGANGKLYMASEDGDVVVVKMGERFEVLATNTLTDQFFIATPAIVDGEIFLRGQNTLFCISAKH